MAASEAQRTALDVLADYGSRNDDVTSWASLGNFGKAPQNVHRDLLAWSRKNGVDLETAKVRVTCRNIHDHGTQSKLHDIIYPHEMFAAIWESGFDNFRHVFLGPDGSSGLVNFWERQSDADWVISHPGLQGDWNPAHVIPLGVHGDKGRHIARDKILNIAWGSVMSTAPTIWSKLLYTILPDDLDVKFKTTEELYAVLVWSFQYLQLGRWPETDHMGKPWAYGTRRNAVAGKPLAGDAALWTTKY